MSSGQAAAWDDAEHYEELCEKFEVKPRYRPGNIYPYNIDDDHYEELKKHSRLAQG